MIRLKKEDLPIPQSLSEAEVFCGFFVSGFAIDVRRGRGQTVCARARIRPYLSNVDVEAFALLVTQ